MIRRWMKPKCVRCGNSITIDDGAVAISDRWWHSPSCGNGRHSSPIHVTPGSPGTTPVGEGGGESTRRKDN